MEAKERIEKILRLTNRPGMEDLMKWMDKNGFYDAPCSSRYHLAKPGGLAEHSLNVFFNAIYFSDSSQVQKGEADKNSFFCSVAVCALLHDIGKVGQFGKPNYIPKADDPAGAFETNKKLLYIPHEVRSIAILSRFIDLTEEEQFAILYHNGLYGELKGFKGNETPLYMILHFADMWASRITESEVKR